MVCAVVRDGQAEGRFMWASRGIREQCGQIAVGLVLSLCGCVLLWLALLGVRSGEEALLSDVLRSHRLQMQVMASATAHAAWVGRLPCPSSTVGGAEDCALDTGWWPHASLQDANMQAGASRVALRYRVDAHVARALHSTDQHRTDALLGWSLCHALSTAAVGGAEAYRVEGVRSHPAGPVDLVVSHSQLSAQLGCPVALSGMAAVQAVMPRGDMATAKVAKGLRDVDLLRFMRVANVVAAAASLQADVGNLINESDVLLQSAVYQAACLGVCPQYVAAMSTESLALGMSEVSMMMAVASLAAHLNLWLTAEATRAFLVDVALWPVQRRATLLENAQQLGSM